ncbi:MAG TPA: DUF115 domain-containing protein [Leptospiraceae bacterium]|nr:DUF115 domain-containing protein [Leptospiraceae bacterium]
MNFFEKNIRYLNPEYRELTAASPPLGNIGKSKTGKTILEIDNIPFHSSHDPEKEAERLIQGLSKKDSNSLYIFFGAGLGYSVLSALSTTEAVCVWMECFPSILKTALEENDFSEYLKSGRLRILQKPFAEDRLFEAFKGLSHHSVSFIAHRGSLNWKQEEYQECRFICEKFFQKKDVNIATLSKFEKIWTKNILQNLRFLPEMKPVSFLFGLLKGMPAVVTGAGPSLHKDINDLKKYREYYFLITVDTALHVLEKNGIEPDLIYSVDPQPINKSYLEGYGGTGILVFDPTSCTHTLRLSEKFQKGFFTSSPFPLMKLFTDFLTVEAGDVPFGGSVSTNAVSLAELMGAGDVLFFGQDLAFTDGFAHCKGAILEERLNFKESRKHRRELHNYRQLFALPKLTVESYSGESLHTNEKMQIFRKWFEDHSKGKNWIHCGSGGGIIQGLKKQSMEEYFSDKDMDDLKRKLLSAKSALQEKMNADTKQFFQKDEYFGNLNSVCASMTEFETLLKKGISISEKIYGMILNGKNGSQDFFSLISQMEKIDEKVSSKKGLNDYIGLGVQRVILMITEGFDSELTLEEKKNEKLGIAKKSILLYKGLHETSYIIRRMIKKNLLTSDTSSLS